MNTWSEISFTNCLPCGGSYLLVCRGLMPLACVGQVLCVKKSWISRISTQNITKKKSIIDGTVKVESLLITDNMSSKVVSFFKESSR